MPNDLNAGPTDCHAVSDGKYVYVIGGRLDNRTVKTMYGLSLKTFKWSTMASMGTARYNFAIVLHGGYIYVLGGDGGDGYDTAERYSIVYNIWEVLPHAVSTRSRFGNLAFTLDSDIYNMGDHLTLDIFDTVSLRCKAVKNLANLPEVR